MSKHIRSRNEIDHDFRDWFLLVKTDSSIYSWTSLAKKIGVSRSQVITSFEYHPNARAICDKIFLERLDESILIPDASVLLENYASLLDKKLIVPSPVVHQIAYLKANADSNAATVYKLITQFRIRTKEYDAKLGRKITRERWWAQIENESYSKLPVEPENRRVGLAKRSVITKALNYMEFGKHVVILTSSYDLVNLIKLQCDKSVPPKYRINIDFKFIPPSKNS